MKPAGFWIRLVAFLIDLILLNGVEFLVLYAISRALNLSPFVEQLVDVPLWLGAYGYYYLFYQVKHQATLGKRWMGLKVVRSEQDKGDQPISRAQALGRLFGYLGSLLILGCGYLMVLFHPEKKALHDLLSRTRVVRVSRAQ
jgi:uncharacterized RDD family membrane protein YckC